MLIYDFQKREKEPLYEFLYRCIKEDILSGRLKAGTRLPSKRELARDNGISVRTVLGAYEQLIVEGYLTAKEKRGYFVAEVEASPVRRSPVPEFPPMYQEDQWFVDFTSNTVMCEQFPFSTWRKVMREVLSNGGQELVRRADFIGVKELRQTIASYLYRTRGMEVSPECIVIGAGIEYLYERLIRILPRDAIYGMENPGYRKIPRIYEDAGLTWRCIGMDENGISMESLIASQADVIHVSPEHHYPLGTVTSATRRQELLNWAGEKADRYIIEDDYDCEFRYRSRSIPALQSMDRRHRVIYMNTFSKTLAPSIRISYMILPEKLMARYIKTTNFYSNTVGSCEQYALARFIQQGYFERHISRLKKRYFTLGQLLIQTLRQSTLLPISEIRGGESGTHLLVRVDTSLTDVEIKWGARQQGICLSCLSEFLQETAPEYEHILVLQYADLDENTMQEAVRRLGNIFTQW
ncbi:PLP-dependent aminotransferase family protein [Brotaphodocola sp.]|uniref:MocR-like pyridoxine biosynthesis transcription factor PdxR n=1 Tax=Brotaphodocola sp. TaxID=3073577 RepID=UPI003D7DE179